MNSADFFQSITEDAPPPGLGLPLQALWYDGKGDWEKAHQLAQQAHSREGDWVHAYLHRREGDESNAAYWYAKAGRLKPGVSVQEEWKQIVEALVKE